MEPNQKKANGLALIPFAVFVGVYLATGITLNAMGGEMAERLTHLPEDMKARLGEIAVTYKKDRFCFHIPEQGSEYVHEHTAENEFIKELIELVREHGCTKKKILELFGQYSENTITEEMNNGEFDFYVRFPEGSEDRYYYCFKDEGCHIIYHRFLPEDYADFEF